jgi:hypothetical protein
MRTSTSARRLGLLLTAALVLSGIIVAVALAAPGPAPRWKVAGAFLVNEKSFEGTNTEKVLITVPAVSLKIEVPKGECTFKGKIVGSGNQTPGTDKEAVLKCIKAVVIQPAGGVCTVQSAGKAGGTIEFNKLKGTLVWTTNENLPAAHLLVPEVGTEWGKIEVLGGKECTPAKTYTVEKELLGEFRPIAEESEHATLTFPEPVLLKWWNNEETQVEQKATQLSFGGNPATFRSVFSFDLNPLENFRIAEG